MAKIVLKPSWNEYVSQIERLFGIIEADGFEPDCVVGIATGGLIPAIILAKYFRVPMATLAAGSYETGESGYTDQRGEVRVGSSLAVVDSNLKGNLILIDDLTDSGQTMNYCRRWLLRQYSGQEIVLATAVIYHKAGSVFRPNYLANTVEADADGDYPWIDQPFEKYERMRSPK